MGEKVDLKETLEEMGYELEEVVEDRNFLISGEINDELVREFHTWKKSLSELESPVTIEINSPGGCADSMFAIIAMMEDFKEIHGKVLSSCYSAALGIFCSCHKRSMGKHADLLYHLAIYAAEGNIKDHQEQLKISKRLQDRYEEIIMNASTLKKNEFKRNRDWYINSDEAKMIQLINV